LVVCPVPVRKFSAGSAKKARYASECPSSSSSRRPVEGTVGDEAAVFWPVAGLRVRVAGLTHRV
jgi:hypothetical protein